MGGWGGYLSRGAARATFTRSKNFALTMVRLNPGPHPYDLAKSFPEGKKRKKRKKEFKKSSKRERKKGIYIPVYARGPGQV